MMKTKVLTTIIKNQNMNMYIYKNTVCMDTTFQTKKGKSSWIHESIGDLSRRLPSHESIILNYQ